MRKRICITTVFVMMMLTIMPTGVSAETNDWTYDANNRTLTSADQNITLYNVRASNKHLDVYKRQDPSCPIQSEGDFLSPLYNENHRPAVMNYPLQLIRQPCP